MTKVNFCNIPFLSNDYSNVVDFVSSSQRENFLKSYSNFSKDCNIKYDGERTYLTINVPCETMLQYDYCYFRDRTNKLFCYFINGVEFITQNTTKSTKYASKKSDVAIKASV